MQLSQSLLISTLTLDVAPQGLAQHFWEHRKARWFPDLTKGPQRVKRGSVEVWQFDTETGTRVKVRVH
jgi:hypothetical protein